MARGGRALSAPKRPMSRQIALAVDDPEAESAPGIMELVAPPEVRATMFPWQDPDGAAHLTVVVKQTFRITARGLAPDPDPVPILLADEHLEGDPLLPPRLESDCAPFKPRADVLLVGRAHAPGGRPVEQLVAGFRVGALRRAIAVVGDRRWRTRTLGKPAMDAPKPFTTMDLGWDRAFGGATGDRLCEENPVGCGIVFDEESIDGTRLPNLEDPRRRIESWTDRPPPVGVGFVGRGWVPRRCLAGVSHAFHNAAPAEQQIDGYLRGDEEVELVNLTPDGHVRFRLPGRRPALGVTRWTASPLEWLATHPGVPSRPLLREAVIAPALDTLILLPEERRACLVHRAVCDLAHLDGLEIARVTVRL
jgi:hypothetical protein